VGPYDAIFCGITMIYFGSDRQRGIIQRLVPLVKTDGLWFAGYAESFFWGPSHPPLRKKRCTRSQTPRVGERIERDIPHTIGKDGAVGMRDRYEAGAHTVAQDEARCVVFGMPGAAIAKGAEDEVLPLRDISRHVLKRLAATGGAGNRI
jgi:hypothetical protein